MAGFLYAPLVLGILIGASVFAPGPFLGPAGALRTQDSLVIGNATVKTFQTNLSETETYRNTTLLLPLNATAKVIGGQLNLSGMLHTHYLNLSGNGSQANDGEGWGLGLHGGGDYNIDGYDDLVIGTPSEQAANLQGRVEIFYGSSTGIRGNHSNWTFKGPGGFGFGWSITHGDYNNDGIDDLVVGDDDYARAAGETIYIFYGSSGGLQSVPDLTIRSDVLNPTGWGWSMAGGLDLDNDGYDDLVVSESLNTSAVTNGSIVVLWGGVDGLALANSSVITGFTTQRITGRSTYIAGIVLEGLGDTDGDGFDEFAAGTPAYSGNRGRVEVFEGAGNRNVTSRWSSVGPSVVYFGWAIAGGYDITGDGIEDLAVGAPVEGSTQRGATYIFNGTGNGAYNTTAATTLRPPGVQSVDRSGMPVPDQFGVGVEILANFDGDGKSELVVGANGFDVNDGRAWMYRAFDFKVANAFVFRSNGTGLAEGMGWKLGTAGDLDGDGSSDLALQLSAGINGSYNPGGVYAYYGGAHVFPEDVAFYVGDTPIWTLAGRLDGNVTVTGFGPVLQAYLDAHGADVNASGLILIPLSFNFSLGGLLGISNIFANYSLVLAPEGVAVAAPPVGSSLVVSWTLHATDGTVYSVWSNKSGAWEIMANVSLPKSSYNDTNVTDGVRYWYYLTEWDPFISSQSPPSPTVSGVPQDLLPPATPGNFSVLVNSTSQTATLRWLPSPDDTIRYEIWRRDGDAGAFAPLATVNVPLFTYTDGPLPEEVNFTYRVLAVDDAGFQSTFTRDIVARVLDITPPATPRNVVGVSATSGTAVILGWDANTDDTVGYTVLRSNTNLTGSFNEIVQTTGLTATVSGLVRGQEYYFQVAAIDKVGQRSVPSPTLTLVTVDDEPPAAPTIVEVGPHPAGNTLVVNWTAVGDDLAGFGLYSNSSGSWSLVTLIGATLRTAQVPDLADGVRAYVRVSAFDTAGHEGPFSAVGSGVPADTQRPAAPPSISVTPVPAGSALTVSWGPSPDADVVGYKVFFLDPSVGSNFQLVAVVDAPGLNFTHGNLTNGASYRYRVAAFDEVPNEGASGPEAVGKPRDSIAPPVPRLSAVSSPTNVVNIAISGTAEAGLQVEIWVRGARQVTVTADSTSHFQAEAKLIRGDNEIYAKSVDPSPVVDPAYKTSPPSQSIHVGLDPDKPALSSSIPAADASNVDPSLPLVITFNEGVRNETIQFVLKDAQGNPVAGSLSYEAARNILRFKPTAALQAGVLYKVEVSAVDLAGNAMTPVSYSFTTRPSSTTTGGGGGLPGLDAMAAIVVLGGGAGLAVAARRKRLDP